MASEAAREREMHRYYQPWLETFMSTEFEAAAIPPVPTDEAEAHHPRSSRDKALTAFAQLGCLRLNAKRSVVTLLGTTKQFIMAEATKSLSLLSDSQHDQGDELWFGNAFIERDGGISADAMSPERYTAYDSDGSSFTAPAMVISDITNHETYKTRGYAGRGVNFYCGVPITSSLGHVIGVYTVTDDKPRNNVSATELRFLVDMSVIVIQHLESVRNDRARKRGERLINGIGGFIEGYVPEESSSAKTSAYLGSATGSVTSQRVPRPKRPPFSVNPKAPDFLGLHISDANPSYEGSENATRSLSERPTSPSQPKSPGREQDNTLDQQLRVPPPAKSATSPRDKAIQESQQVFSRAAAILRSCLVSDGAIFFNASSANLSSGSRLDNSGSVVRVQHNKSSGKRRPSEHNDARPQTPHRRATEYASSPSSDESTTSRSNSDSSGSKRTRQQKCQILGLSVNDPANPPSIMDQTLRRLVRRFPRGKCFTFDEFGRPASGDEGSETVSANEHPKEFLNQSSNATQRVPTTNALLKALPGARNIVFLPLWDFGKERWHSGLVIWGNGTLTNVEDNMVYLKAFSNAIMNEVNRIDLVLSDAAKSTFLANISHELRSPLHGILGSIEFLHDTAMDDFQSSMVISVETCGKTLLDTVNHVLDHAKIHNLVKSHRRAKKSGDTGGQPNKAETSLTEDFDMAIIVEEAVEAVYAGQVFRTANADALEGNSPYQTAASRAMQQRQDRKDAITKDSQEERSPICLTLNIDDHPDWRVRTQPGAVRRIVMNILGNALKYTGKGAIDVSLEIDRSRSKASSNLHMMLRITDTGFGMSDDFMKNHAFTAFSQEDSLATGTGLGLSIVRQIVDSLGGKIDLSSKKDVGTEVLIWLSLPKSRQEKGTQSGSNIIPEMRSRTTGHEVCMLQPYEEERFHNGLRSVVPMPTIESSMRNLISQWFRMKVTATKSMDGLSPDFFIYPEPPPIDYLMNFHGKPNTDFEIPVIILCTNAFEAASLRSNGVHYLTDIGRIIEVISQPCGPQKLARVLHRCMQRSEMLKNNKAKKGGSSPGAVVSLTKKQQDTNQGDPAEERGPPAPNPPAGNPGISEMRADLSKITTDHEPKSPRRPSLNKTGSSEASIPRSPITERDRSSSTSDSNSNSNSPRVLVVDDNHINLHLLVTFLRKSNHPYESATDGLQAVEAYKKALQQEDGKGPAPFKYILMDISMPVMNGMTATKEIRKFEKEKGVKEPAKIIALTGMGSDIAQNEARDAGFDQFLSKPIKFRDLVKLLV
ncbi:hypothetical protein H2200_005186 [Cladophialophora chaetospira]|uniref:Sensor histidine kinase/response regulator n=1 Tax=Cladophialophora chaetospira TaxID=386627 RepID=A0AA39CIQ2_9EURO|nr:hypothetical protein H2200_005186 [Cladophialophora chaetospira]